MNTKICPTCQEEKDIKDFYQKKDRKKGASSCKICFNKYCTERSIQKKIDAIIYKGSKCNDCDISYPKYPYVIFDFHHTNPTNKDFDWSKMRLISKERMLSELDKCDLFCSSCHRIRHHKELVAPQGIEPQSKV